MHPVHVEIDPSYVQPAKPKKLTRSQRAVQRGRCGACLKKSWDCRCKARTIGKAKKPPVLASEENSVEVAEVSDATAE